MGYGADHAFIQDEATHLCPSQKFSADGFISYQRFNILRAFEGKSVSIYSTGGYTPIQSYGTQQEFDDLWNRRKAVHDLKLSDAVAAMKKSIRNEPWDGMRRVILQHFSPGSKVTDVSEEALKKIPNYDTVTVGELAVAINNNPAEGCDAYRIFMKQMSNRLVFATNRLPIVTPANLLEILSFLVKLNLKGGSVRVNLPQRQHKGHSLALQEMENQWNYGYDDEYDDEYDDGYDDGYADGDWSLYERALDNLNAAQEEFSLAQKLIRLEGRNQGRRRNNGYGQRHY